jgi:hypothetical protein
MVRRPASMADRAAGATTSQTDCDNIPDRESLLHEREPHAVASSCQRNEQERAYRQLQFNMEIHSVQNIEANIFLGQREYL